MPFNSCLHTNKRKLYVNIKIDATNFSQLHKCSSVALENRSNSLPQGWGAPRIPCFRESWIRHCFQLFQFCGKTSRHVFKGETNYKFLTVVHLTSYLSEDPITSNHSFHCNRHSLFLGCKHHICLLVNRIITLHSETCMHTNCVAFASLWLHYITLPW